MVEAKRPLKSTTRSFDTTFGEISYAELSDLIAPKLTKLLDDVTNGKYASSPIDEELILKFHHQIIGEIIPEIAGKWRKGLVQVGNHLPPEPFNIPILMREYTRTLSERINNANSIELQIEALAYAEGEFLHIHPFQDFNGRTIRVLLREILLRFNLPLVETYVERETPAFTQYQNALAEYDNRRVQALVDFWIIRFNNFNNSKYQTHSPI